MFYNENIKKDFMNQLDTAGMSDNYNKAFKILFTVSKDIEESFKRDLYDFNVEETEGLIKSLRSMSKQSINTRLSMIVMYRKWAYQQRLTQNILITKAIEELNPEDLINITAEKDKYITKEELYVGSLEIPNARDALVLLLLWWGIKGDGLEEIYGLKKENIKRIGNEIILSDRTVVVDDFTMDLIMETINTNTYTTIGNNGTTYEKKLAKNDYVIKKVPNKRWGCEFDPISRQSILKIIINCKEVLKKDYINSTNIYKSGQYHRFTKQYRQEIKEFLKDNKKKIDFKIVRDFLKKEMGKDVTPSYVSVFLSEYKRYAENYISKEIATDKV